MQLAFGTPHHWLQRSKDAREIARDMANPEAKKAMLAVAESYAKIAQRAEVRLIEKELLRNRQEELS